MSSRVYVPSLFCVRRDHVYVQNCIRYKRHPPSLSCSKPFKPVMFSLCPSSHFLPSKQSIRVISSGAPAILSASQCRSSGDSRGRWRSDLGYWTTTFPTARSADAMRNNARGPSRRVPASGMGMGMTRFGCAAAWNQAEGFHREVVVNTWACEALHPARARLWPRPRSISFLYNVVLLGSLMVKDVLILEFLLLISLLDSRFLSTICFLGD